MLSQLCKSDDVRELREITGSTVGYPDMMSISGGLAATYIVGTLWVWLLYYACEKREEGLYIISVVAPACLYLNLKSYGLWCGSVLLQKKKFH